MIKWSGGGSYDGLEAEPPGEARLKPGSNGVGDCLSRDLCLGEQRNMSWIDRRICSGRNLESSTRAGVGRRDQVRKPTDPYSNRLVNIITRGSWWIGTISRHLDRYKQWMETFVEKSVTVEEWDLTHCWKRKGDGSQEDWSQECDMPDITNHGLSSWNQHPRRKCWRTNLEL